MFRREPKVQTSVSWFEIPATDLDRAIDFYSKVLGIEIEKGEFMGEMQGFFPANPKGGGGAIVQTDRATPAATGPLIYLSVGSVKNLEQALERVESSGGKNLRVKTQIEDSGFIGVLQDSEGNHIGLHAT